MVENTHGIVLNRIKYSDNSIIVPIFTQKFGRQSYLIYGNSTKKNGTKLNLFQPLYVLDLQAYQRENRDLQKLKEYAISFPVHNLYSDSSKNGIALFISEFLYRSIRENEPDTLMFEFLIRAVKFLEHTKTPVYNFHIGLLLKMTVFFGIEPEQNYSESAQLFDLQNARFTITPPNHPHYCSQDVGIKLNEFMHTPLEETHHIKLSKNQRSILINSLLDFYNIHIERPGKLKSLEILQSVFA